MSKQPKLKSRKIIKVKPKSKPTHAQLESKYPVLKALKLMSKAEKKQQIQAKNEILLDNHHNIQKFFLVSKQNARFLRFSKRSLMEASSALQAKQTTNLIKKYLGDLKTLCITETSAGIGGNTQSFAKSFAKCQPIEYDVNNVAFLRNNMRVVNKKYDHIHIHSGNCLNILPTLQQDVIFMDPPWGGTDYKTNKMSLEYKDSSGKPIDVSQITREYSSNANLIVLKVPYNFDKQTFFAKTGCSLRNHYVVDFICQWGKVIYQLIFMSDALPKQRIPQQIKSLRLGFKSMPTTIVRKKEKSYPFYNRC